MSSNDLRVRFGGLKDGEHDFHFDIHDKFFEYFDSQVIKRGELGVDIIMIKKTNLLVLENTVHGKVEVECDRCLDLFYIPVYFSDKLIVKIEDSGVDKNNILQIPDNDIMYVSPTENEMVLNQYFYESIMLSLPFKRVHPNDANGRATCNKEMIAKLKKHLVNEGKKEDKTDPRWDILKDLMNNN